MTHQCRPNHHPVPVVTRRKAIIQKIVQRGSGASKDLLGGANGSGNNILSRFARSAVDQLTGHRGGGGGGGVSSADGPLESSSSSPEAVAAVHDEETKGLLAVVSGTAPHESSDAEQPPTSLPGGDARTGATVASWLRHAGTVARAATASWLSESWAVLLGHEQGGRALPALHTQVVHLYVCLRGCLAIF